MWGLDKFECKKLKINGLVWFCRIVFYKIWEFYVIMNLGWLSDYENVNRL